MGTGTGLGMGMGTGHTTGTGIGHTTGMGTGHGMGGLDHTERMHKGHDDIHENKFSGTDHVEGKFAGEPHGYDETPYDDDSTYTGTGAAPKKV